MCGAFEKACGICGNAGGCLAAMYEDFYIPATREQVIKRLLNGEYPYDTKIMMKYIGIKNIEELRRYK